MSPPSTGPSRGPGPGLPRPTGGASRPWLWPVLACAALLLLPALVWLLIPRPPGFAPPQPASAVETEPAPSEIPVATASPVRPARRPRPAASAVEAEADAPV